jgi:hypothetical protein
MKLKHHLAEDSTQLLIVRQARTHALAGSGDTVLHDLAQAVLGVSIVCPEWR